MELINAAVTLLTNPLFIILISLTLLKKIARG